MQTYVKSLTESAGRQTALLDRIIATDHARFLNTLARLEYVGVRKMLKSRRAERLDLDGLQHMLDETIHAMRLKKAALAVGDVKTFAAADTLAGDEGEAYFQTVDHAAEAALADLPEDRRADVNYLLSSAAIEVRAQAFYPLYESRLRAFGVPVSVAAILRDEDRHLAEMAERLTAALPDWRARLERVLAEEARAFDRFLDAMEDALPAMAQPRRAGSW
jgi:predicted component of type VI protein secretion system